MGRLLARNTNAGKDTDTISAQSHPLNQTDMSDIAHFDTPEPPEGEDRVPLISAKKGTRCDSNFKAHVFSLT